MPMLEDAEGIEDFIARASSNAYEIFDFKVNQIITNKEEDFCAYSIFYAYAYAKASS